MNVTVTARAIELPADFPRNPRIWQAEQVVAAVAEQLNVERPTIVKLGGSWSVVGAVGTERRSFSGFVADYFNRAVVQVVPFK